MFKEPLGAKSDVHLWRVSLVALVFVFLMVPERKNRSLEGLDEIFQNRVPVRKFASYVTSGLGSHLVTSNEKRVVLAAEVEVRHEETAEKA